MKTNENELRVLLQKLANEEIETVPEQSKYVAEVILNRDLVGDLLDFASDYAPVLGGTREETLTECVLDYYTCGAQITVYGVEGMPSGELVFYGTTKEDSLRVMREFADKRPEHKNRLDGKILSFNRDPKKYRLRVVNSSVEVENL